MRRIVALVMATAISAVGCGADAPTTDALGSLDAFDVEVGDRSCGEAGDECARAFRFRSTTLSEIVELVVTAGYPIDQNEPQAALRACKPDEPARCAFITEDGSTVRVVVSSPAG